MFEGGPVLEPPLQQDRERRRPVAVDGDALDTFAACPPLSIVETAKLDELRARARQRLKPEAARARAAFIDWRAPRIVERTGVSMAAAKRIVARQCDGILLPDVELVFDDDEFKGCTVADVLADPARFEDATLADPLEGVEYGRCKAMIMREESASVADVLAEMAEEWPNEREFKATEVAEIINESSRSFNQRGFILSEFLFPGAPLCVTVSARSVANRLKKHRDGPVKCGDRMLVLRSRPKDNELLYHVHIE